MSKKFLHILPFTICCIMGLSCKGENPEDYFCPKGPAIVTVIYADNTEDYVYMGYNSCKGKYYSDKVKKPSDTYEVVNGDEFHLGLREKPWTIKNRVEAGKNYIYTCSILKERFKEPVLSCNLNMGPAVIKPIK